MGDPGDLGSLVDQVGQRTYLDQQHDSLTRTRIRLVLDRRHVLHADDLIARIGARERQPEPAGDINQSESHAPVIPSGQAAREDSPE